tara:strand:+ start:38 stop:694 length:657 start_codon:yes stop_codon:yes gene_type:complete
MKLILERFKRFLQGDKLNQLALFHAKDSDVQTVVLYVPSLNPSVIAGIEIAKTQEPCVPLTYQVEWVFTKKEYRGEGVGEDMYGICFFLVNRLGMGLTSDQNAGTSAAAGKRWAKLVKDKNTVARKTPFGNSEFDYDGNKTPKDPLDNCGLDGKGPKGAGIDQSLMMKDYKKYAELYRKLKGNHQKFLSTVPDNKKKQFENDLEQIAFEEFSIAYDGD